MVLRVVPIPDAIVGNDWKHTVPGRYLYNVTGVQAVLNGSATLQAHDSSGNNNDGSYITGGAGQLSNPFGQPGAVTGDAGIAYPLAVNTAPRIGMPILSAPIFNGSFTIEWWSPNANPIRGGDWFVFKPTATSALAVRIQNDGAAILSAIYDVGGYELTPGAGTILADGQWHHYVWSVVASAPATSKLYRDGVSLPFATSGAAATPPPTQFAFHMDTAESAGPDGMDEIALYPTALSAARVAAHYAARGDFTAYSAAVLADAPAAYYHLDEVGGPGGRAPALEITDGSTIVELVPSGFPRSATVGTQTFSWQPRLQAGAESADETLVTVPTPQLILPAGYTIGTFTPDLGPNDQWTDIVLWWDDAYQTATEQAASYQYAPGAHLVYQQQRAAP